MESCRCRLRNRPVRKLWAIEIRRKDGGGPGSVGRYGRNSAGFCELFAGPGLLGCHVAGRRLCRLAQFALARSKLGHCLRVGPGRCSALTLHRVERSDEDASRFRFGLSQPMDFSAGCGAPSLFGKHDHCAGWDAPVGIVVAAGGSSSGAELAVDGDSGCRDRGCRESDFLPL